MKLYKYWAPWCNPCRAMAPVVEKLCKEKNIELVSVNVDEMTSEDKVSKNLKSIPTFDLQRGDDTVVRLNGIHSLESLVKGFNL